MTKDVDESEAAEGGNGEVLPQDETNTPDNVIQFPSGKKKKSRVREATQSEIISFINTTLGDLKRDIFTDKLLYRNNHTAWAWKSARNAEETIKAQAKELSRIARENNEGAVYPLDAIGLNLAYLYDAMKPARLFDLPEWDREDRIAQMTSSLVLNEDSPIKTKEAEELIKDWCSKTWQRIENPKLRNRILILTGPQNIGKDWWIDNLTGGFSRWSNHLSMGKDHKDMYRQLNENAVLKIPEFDRTSRIEVQMVKDIVTRPDTDIRKPYDADSEQRPCRCSFISSCNIQDVLRDPTGATRYIIIDVDKITYDYPNDPYSVAQILAQIKHLGDTGYRASKETELGLQSLLDHLTPESLEELVTRDWFAEAPEKLIEEITKLPLTSSLRSLTTDNPDWFPASIAKNLLTDISKRYSVNLQRIYQILKVRGLRKEVGHHNAVGYRVRLANLDEGTLF
jgi:hypothetical protein